MCLAIPGQVVEILSDTPTERMGRIAFGGGGDVAKGVTKEANLLFVPEAQVGDYVLVHVGFAISKLNEEEAQEVFRAMKDTGIYDHDEEAGSAPKN